MDSPVAGTARSVSGTAQAGAPPRPRALLPAPCLREALVARLRERLRRGDYDPDPRDVAAGLLSLACGDRPMCEQPADDPA